MKNAIYILCVYHFVLRTTVNYFDSDHLYYFLDAILIGLVAWFVYSKSEISIRNRVAFYSVLSLAACQSINQGLTMLDSSIYIIWLPELITAVGVIDIGIWTYTEREAIKDWIRTKWEAL